MNRSERRHQARAAASFGSHTAGPFPDRPRKALGCTPASGTAPGTGPRCGEATAPVSLVEAVAQACLRFGPEAARQAVCHVATPFGHGVCRWAEVMAVTVDAFRGPKDTWPEWLYGYRTGAVAVRRGLLSPGEDGSGGPECVGIVPVGAAVHAVTVVVPRDDYDALFARIKPPQRVRPAVRDGALVFDGIDPRFDLTEAAQRQLSLDDILAL